MTKRVRKDLTQTVREDLSDEVILWTELNEVKIRQVVSDRNQGATSVKTTGPVHVWHILRETEKHAGAAGSSADKGERAEKRGSEMKSEEQPGTRSERTCRPRDVCRGATETIQQGLMHPDCASERIPWMPCGELKRKATSRLLQQSH